MSEASKKTIQGVELTESQPGIFKMANKDYNKVLDGLGVTKEVRDVVQKAEETLITESLGVVRDAVINDEHESAEVILGTGDGQLKVGLTGVKNGMRATAEGERVEYTNYGSASVRMRKVFPNTVRTGVLREIEEECEKVFSKK